MLGCHWGTFAEGILLSLFLEKNGTGRSEVSFLLCLMTVSRKVWLAKPHEFLVFIVNCQKGCPPHGNCYNYFYNIGICKLFRVQGIKSWEGGWKDINSEVQQMENASSIVEMSNYSHYIHCMVGKIITEMKGVLCVQTSQWPLIRMGLIFIHIH